jgi:two-component system response regulator HydG
MGYRYNRPAMGRCKGKILLVDDDIDLLELVRDQFKARGYTFVWKESADQALAALGGTDFDLVITDLRMPGMDGMEFVKRLKEISPKLPIILMTGHGSVEVAVRAIRAGAYDFALKPLNFTHLGVSIERALRTRKLERENEALRREALSFEGIVGRHPRMQQVFDLVTRVAPSAANVLITGESGTGKEIIARAIHAQSPRRDKPFVAINCSAIPDNLLESELFGYVKGAFTGASEKKLGLFEEASGGVLFLDEIGDLPLPLQAKLLRVLQERKIKRLGENQFRSVDVRIVAATHRDLKKAAAEKTFREDLYYRLCVIPIQVPALRERREDIPHLAQHFLAKFRALNGTSEDRATCFTRAAMDRMLQHTWPGNVRELENAIERAVVLCSGQEIDVQDLPEPERLAGSGPGLTFEPPRDVMTLEEVSRRYIHYVLEQSGGVKDRAARALGIDRKTLYRWIQERETSSGRLN